MRIAVVTPYYNESREMLERCAASVRAQSVPVDQIFVADGDPQYWLEEAPNVAHIVLRKRTADYGDTPRSLGLVLGLRTGYDILQFLDADNFLAPDHFDETLRHFRGRIPSEYPDLVLAKRTMVRPDGSPIPVALPDEDAFQHVDTSCFVFYRTAFRVAIKWSLIPPQIGFMDDRVFFAVLSQRHPELKVAYNEAKTVRYTCLWESFYHDVGETPPANSKNLEAKIDAAQRWWRSLDDHAKDVVQRLLGIPILMPEDAVRRRS